MFLEEFDRCLSAVLRQSVLVVTWTFEGDLAGDIHDQCITLHHRSDTLEATTYRQYQRHSTAYAIAMPLSSKGTMRVLDPSWSA